MSDGDAGDGGDFDGSHFDGSHFDGGDSGGGFGAFKPQRERPAPCTHCGKGARSPIGCKLCGRFSSNVFCSERFLHTHFKRYHGADIAAQQEAQRHKEIEDAKERLADELEAKAAELRGGKKRAPTAGGTIGNLVVLVILVVVCAGIFSGFAGKGDKAEGELRDAEKLWAAGKRAEAVAKYKEHFASAKYRPEILKRIVEHETDARNVQEATRWVEKGLDENLVIAYDTPATKALLGTVQLDRERRARERAEAERRRQQEELTARLREWREGQGAAREAAADALGAMTAHAPQIVPALLETLQAEGQAAARPAALRALKRLGAAAAVPLAAVVSGNKDEKARLQAVRALAAIGPPARQAAPALAAAARETAQGPLPLRYEAAAALASLDPVHEQSLPLLEEALGYDAPARLLALKHLSKLGARAKRAWPAVRKAANGALPMSYVGEDQERLTADTPELRAEAAAAVARLLGLVGAVDSASVAGLIEALKDGDRGIRNAAAAALGRVGRPAVAPLLVALTEKSNDVRLAVVTALGEMGPPAVNAVPFLQALVVGDGSQELRLAARDAVRRIQEK